jgi:hypothetical protein
MCGGGASQTTGGTSTSEIPEYLRKASKANIGAANAFADKWGKSTKDEKSAYGGIRDNSAWSESMMPYQQGLISSLYGGGGMGEGADEIRQAWAQTAPVYGQYLQPGYLDPMSNPYLQPAIEAARSGAYNDVAGRFHKAGRSFSGSEGAAYGDAAAKAALPMLLGQYNTNVGAQQGAASGLLGAASGTSAGLDAAQKGILTAQMAAPGQMNNLNIPENMLLGISDRQRAAALQALNAKLAAVSSTPFASSTTTSGITSQNSDPFQALMGGGLGLLGMFM